MSMKYLSICFLVLFFSCARHEEKVHIVTEFEVKGELKASVQKIPASIAIVRGMFVSGDYLFLYKQKDSTLFDIFHLPDCKLVSHAGRRGEGPDDFIFLDP